MLTRAASKKAKTESSKLRRRPRTYSFSPGRNESIGIDRSGRHGETAFRSRAAQDTEQVIAAGWNRTPTLHPTRRKSSKRRREDHDREAEIKAMSVYMPIRSGLGSNGRSGSKKSTKRAKTGGLGRDFEPASQISLSYPDSVRSGMSRDSEFISYKITALDSLAPRPTLRYASSAKLATPRATVSVTAEPRKMSLGETVAADQDHANSRRRINELADGLDAKDLRELMERDNRRRERKRLQEQEGMERRLASRTERQRREQLEAIKSVTPLPQNLERGVMGRELAGLSAEPASTVVTSSKRRALAMPPTSSWGSMDRTQPLDLFHRPETSPQDEQAPSDVEHAQPRVANPAEPNEPLLALPEGSELDGLARSKNSRSKSTLGSDKSRPADEECGRKNSESSHKIGSRLSLSSLLKWGSKGKRHSGPSSFSNASREEMHVGATPSKPAQAEALARLQGEDMSIPTNHLTGRPASSVPKRTKSRFREDLPEFPISPPDSRVQSPEDDFPLPRLPEKPLDVDLRPTPPSRHDTPPCTERSKGTQSAEPHLSMSLASIDSEGSWLSGRVGSSKTTMKQESCMRANRREYAHPSDSPTSLAREELAMTDDEYSSRFMLDRNSGVLTSGRRSGEYCPSIDEEDISTAEKAKWGQVGARPEVVQFHNHDRDTMHSRQGLVNIDSEDEEDADMLVPNCLTLRNS
ncbi:uncharacterized protein UV8b_04467 [Ustilaginoidea virens]|uniref:Uncharacterized protein n=2 Tax=Ustilaginoidea virens TaxID=1159556 RepID=A0A8E5MI01_USTVR|nr:uncharacterized protein UV8b_04467 [Ustilaginoidea virens]QUC20226.1 hypothetical protein UV8b_04467 [Ustilaginoidea virens]